MSFQDFQDLGNGILIFNPPRQEGKDHQFVSELAAADQPALIILCTWLGGASTKRIQRYTIGYHRLWPLSTILLIRTTATEYAVSGIKALHDKLRPARREIRRVLDAGRASLTPSSETTPRAPGILLHMFSNGGANIATQLVASMNAILTVVGTGAPLPLRQVVLDSGPGDLGIGRTYAAAAHSIPTGHPLRPLLCAVLYLVVAGLAGLEAAGVRRQLGRTMRDQLNDPAVFAPNAGRLYLTSQADTIIESRHVFSHRAQAAARGLRTEMVVFQRAGHCSLLVEDEGVYWSAIETSWKKGARGSAATGADTTNEEDVEKHGLHLGPPGPGTQDQRPADSISHVRSRL